MSYGSQSRLLLLCPGQGNQHPHMFDLARTSAAASALLDRLALRAPLAGLSTLAASAPADADQNLPQPGGNAMHTVDTMHANRNAQPLIVAATLGMWEAIREFAPQPALVAGYSIGELSAHGVAGAIDADTAIALAARRAQLMDECLQARPGQALLAMSGLAPSRIGALLADVDFYMSIETGDDSCVAGGPAAAVEALERAVVSAGGRGTRLAVEVASHTPYMAAAVAPFAAALRLAPFHTPAAPVLAGISGAAVEGKAQAVDLLSRQLSETIRWTACMDAAAEAGITYALELGPGAALSRMMQARHPHINTRSVADFRTLDGIRKWLGRAAE